MLWCSVITTTQLHSLMPELILYIGSNPARDVSEICDHENLLVVYILRVVNRSGKTIDHHHQIIKTISSSNLGSEITTPSPHPSHHPVYFVLQLFSIRLKQGYYKLR